MNIHTQLISNPYSMDYKKVILGIGFAFVGAYTLSKIMYGRRRKRSDEPYIITGSAFSGCKKDIEHDMKSYLQSCQIQYGDIFTLRMATNEYSTFIMDNKMMKRVLYNKHTDFNKPSRTAKLRFGLSEIVDSDHATETLSKALHHGFADPEHRNKLMQSIEMETKRTINALFTSPKPQQWKISSTKLHEWIRNIVIKIELKVLFGPLFANNNELIALYFDLEHMVPLRLNGGQRRIFDTKMSTLLKIIQSLCTQTEQKCTFPDLPHGIQIANAFCNDNQYSQDARNRLIIALLWGSLSNSSHTMAWMMYRILESVKCQEQIRSELEFQKHIFDVRCSSDCNFRWSQVRALLPSLSSVINEVFRYYGESNICRYLLNDIVVKDDDKVPHKLRGGDWVIAPCSFLHRNPKYFRNPNVFVFDRFVDYKHDKKETKPTHRRRMSRCNQKQAKMLFTFGSKCSGRGFAESLVVILCGSLLYNMEFEIMNEGNKRSVPNVGPIGSFSIPSIDENDDMLFKWRRRNNSMPEPRA